MKANELMIGDWVNVTAAENIVRPDILSILPKKGKVVGIDGDCIYVDFVEYLFMFGDIEPIPLTPEILEKNGFKKCDECEQWTLYKHSCYNILWSADEPYLEIVSYNGDSGEFNRMGISFVHELQHALRLCGIEKEVVL